MTNSASDGWIDKTWQFPQKDKERILDSLDINGPRAQEALTEILSAARLYRSSRANERDQPSKVVTKRKLREISQKCDALVRCLDSLDKSSRDRLEENFGSARPIESTSYALLSDLEREVERLSSAAQLFEQGGRPAKEALGILVNQLALIWEGAHGRWPRRSYYTHKSRESGPFRRFVMACVEGVDPSLSCPDGLVRRVLKGRKTMEKNTRRSKPKPSPKR